MYLGKNRVKESENQELRIIQMMIWLQGLMLMLMLIWLQGGKLVWSDGSPADFSVWLEGGLNYKVFPHLLSYIGLNFLCNSFAHIVIMV